MARPWLSQIDGGWIKGVQQCPKEVENQESLFDNSPILKKKVDAVGKVVDDSVDAYQDSSCLWSRARWGRSSLGVANWNAALDAMHVTRPTP